ncbi:FAD-binding protein [Serratia marcescens]|uniref:FAD-binding protein n=1 Tax=Serratia marcescens TaxID=615 RepID=A0A939NNK8_SERMA|nr:FAD-binding protein [Serratia marcescens]
MDDDARARVALNMMEGTRVQIRANAVVMATGGAGRVYRNTNGGIVTGDGMPTTACCATWSSCSITRPAPCSGILMTEGCRGEGGILVNKDGYRYLQDYGMGPETLLGELKNKYMELGPRDKVSCAFWHEWRAGRTIATRAATWSISICATGREKAAGAAAVHLRTGQAYVGVDPVKDPIPVRPTAHYTMGGIETDQNCETRIRGCSRSANAPPSPARRQPSRLQLAGRTGGVRPRRR